MIRALLLVCLAGCATPASEVCGAVGPLTVKADKHNARVHCPEALAVTREAYAMLPGPLLGAWGVSFTYGFLEFARGYTGREVTGPPGTIPRGGDPVLADGVTREGARLIEVRETRSRAVLHEMFHAYLSEHGWSGTQHQEMCRRGWDRAHSCGVDE
jgi:hypothetical protein